MNYEHVALLVTVCAAIVLGLLLANQRSTSRTLVTALRGGAELVQRELLDLRRRHAQLQQDQQFVAQFLRDFPHLSRELHSGSTERQIPLILLNVMMKILAPKDAVVLIRRRGVEADPARASRLIVAAAAPKPSAVTLGSEIEIGQGTLGFAAETQRVMSRADFDAETAVARARFGKDGLPGFEPDLVAPMVFDEQTLGIIALSRPTRTSDDAKAALRLVAQAGAQALHNAAAYTQIKHTAERDGLTRIFNKRQMTHTLSELIYEASQKVGAAVSVFLFDLDNFKNYNDVNGHVAGDRLLQLLARLVQENVRKADVFGRFGGEEFLLILPETKLPQALAVAEKIRWVISSHAFPHAERQPLGCLSISGGVSEFPGDAQESTAVLRAADRALYEAKRQGRNRVLPAARTYLSDSDPDIAVVAAEQVGNER
jgi:diguanylate cyclase (GGDEF)-like protein